MLTCLVKRGCTQSTEPSQYFLLYMHFYENKSEAEIWSVSSLPPFRDHEAE